MSRGFGRLAVLLGVLAGGAALGASAPVAGHGAPAPPQPYMTRLLADHVDDWPAPLKGHDLVALDAYPSYNVSFGSGPLLVLRLTLGGGHGALGAGTGNPELQDVIRFQANGVLHELRLLTDDNRRFYATEGFVAVRGPFRVLAADRSADHDRFAVEGIVPYESLALEPGAALTGWSVQAVADLEERDAMARGAAPAVPEACASPASGCAAFDIGTYVLPHLEGYYFDAVPPALLPPLEGRLVANVTVRNAFHWYQTLELTARAEGALVSFGGPGAAVATVRADLPWNETIQVRLNITRDPYAPVASTWQGPNGTADDAPQAGPIYLPGNVTLDIVSRLPGFEGDDARGHQVLTIPLALEQHPAYPFEGDCSLCNDLAPPEAEPDAPGAGLPWLGLAGLAAAVGVAALLRRRP